MSPDPLVLILKNDLLTNILNYSEDIGKCATRLTVQIREIIAAQAVGLFELDTEGKYRLIGKCPDREPSVLEDERILQFVRESSRLVEPTLIRPGEYERWNLPADLGTNESFIVPLRVGQESMGILLLLNLMDGRGTEKILDALREITGVLSLVLRHSFLYRNLETLVEQRTRALQLSERRARSIIETAMDGFLVLNRAGTLLEVNDAYCAMVDYSRDELLAMTFQQLEAVKTAGEVATLLHKAFDMKYHRFESVHHRKDGSRLIVDISSQVLPESPGELFAFIRDITDRKRNEETLRESEEKFSLTFKRAPVMAVITVLENGTFLDVNDKFIELGGFTREEVLGKTSTEIGWLRTEDRQNLMVTLLRQGKVSNYEITSYTRDGSPIECLYHCELVTIGGVKRLLTMALDISERKRAEAEREKLETQLNQAQKMESIGRLAGGVAHDFNNMLGVILGNAELALEQVDPNQPLHADIREIQKSARRSADLTRQLLAFARKQTVSPQRLDLNNTIESMLRMLQRLIGENIDLVWLPDRNLWPIKMDPSQIDQILANLCVNARDAVMGVGRVTIETSRTIFNNVYCAQNAGTVPGEYACLAVSDNGKGMEKETLAKIFEPFFTTKEVGKGTGLGMAVVYGIVKQNSGFINVYSEPGKGTTIRIYLPRLEGEVLDGPGTETVEAPRGKGETILLVEDEPAILNMGKRILERLGYRVLAAGTPNEALRLLREHDGAIALIITDVVMPEMNGRELADRAASIMPDIKCLFMSGYTADAIAHHGVLDPGVEFIPKPFTLKDLATKVRKVVGMSC